MRVVKADKPCSIRRMQCHRIIQTMWAFFALVDSLKFEFEPIRLIEIVDALVVTQQVLQPIIPVFAPTHIMI